MIFGAIVGYHEKNSHQILDFWVDLGPKYGSLNFDQNTLPNTGQPVISQFPGYWDRLWYPGLSPVLVSNAFPFAFHIWVFFHSLFFTCHWISFVYFSQWRYLHLATNPPSVPGLGVGTGPQWTPRRSYTRYGYTLTKVVIELE